jgi:hypothetical protein
MTGRAMGSGPGRRCSAPTRMRRAVDSSNLFFMTFSHEYGREEKINRAKRHSRTAAADQLADPLAWRVGAGAEGGIHRQLPELREVLAIKC